MCVFSVYVHIPMICVCACVCLCLSVSPLSRTFVITACFVERLHSLTLITADLNGPNRVKIDRQREGCSLLTPGTVHMCVCVCVRVRVRVCLIKLSSSFTLKDSSSSAADIHTSSNMTHELQAL